MYYIFIYKLIVYIYIYIYVCVYNNILLNSFIILSDTLLSQNVYIHISGHLQFILSYFILSFHNFITYSN